VRARRALHILRSNRLTSFCWARYRGEGRAHITTLLYLLAGWVGLSLLAYLVVYPLLTVSQRAERLGAGPRGLAEASTTGVPSPQRLGYSGVILQRLAQHARTVLGVHRAWIAVSPPGVEDWYTGVAAAGTDADVIGTRFSDPCELGGMASAPVTVGARPRGALCVADPVTGGPLQPRDFGLLAELAGLTGEVLTHHDRRELSSGDSRAEISALVRALGEADGATYRHSLEVAATARAVAERLGLDDVDLVEVELGALLHDVGKLRLPPQILRKAGPLDRQERQLVRLHPEWGAEMVARVPGLEAVALIVRLHHERPDGMGYPHGLRGDRIPIASRIVAACGAYGAMTRRRDYSEPLDVDAALEELELHSGTQFDPLVVEVLASFVREPVAVPVAA
jgi:putative nucleotidyltransferase with HDIG domain